MAIKDGVRVPTGRAGWRTSRYSVAGTACVEAVEAIRWPDNMITQGLGPRRGAGTPDGPVILQYAPGSGPAAPASAAATDQPGSEAAEPRRSRDFWRRDSFVASVPGRERRSATASPPGLQASYLEHAATWEKWTGKRRDRNANLGGGFWEKAAVALRDRGIPVPAIPNGDDGQPLPLTEWPYGTQAAAALANLLRIDPMTDADAISRQMVIGRPRNLIYPAGAARTPDSSSAADPSAGQSSRAGAESDGSARAGLPPGVPVDAADARRARRRGMADIAEQSTSITPQILSNQVSEATRRAGRPRENAPWAPRSPQQERWDRLPRLARLMYGERDALVRSPGDWLEISDWGLLRRAVETMGPGGAALVIVGPPGEIDQALAVVYTTEGLKIADLDGAAGSVTDAGTAPTGSLRQAFEQGRVRALFVTPDGRAVIERGPRQPSPEGQTLPSRASVLPGYNVGRNRRSLALRRKMLKDPTGDYSVRILQSLEWWNEATFNRLRSELNVANEDLAGFSLELGRFPEEIPGLAREWAVSPSLIYRLSRDLKVSPGSLYAIRRYLRKVPSPEVAKGRLERDVDHLKSYMVQKGTWPEGRDRPKLDPLLLFARYAKIDINHGMADLARFLSYPHEEPVGLLRIEDVFDLPPAGIAGYADDWREAEVKQATMVANSVLATAGIAHRFSDAELRPMVAEVVESLLGTPDFAELLGGPDLFDAVTENPRILRNAWPVVESIRGRLPVEEPESSVQDPPDDRREAEFGQAAEVANSVLVMGGVAHRFSDAELRPMVAEVVESLLGTPDFAELLGGPDLFDAISENPRILRNAWPVVESFGGQRPVEEPATPPRAQDAPDLQRKWEGRLSLSWERSQAADVAAQLVKHGLRRRNADRGEVPAEVVDAVADELAATPEFRALLPTENIHESVRQNPDSVRGVFGHTARLIDEWLTRNQGSSQADGDPMRAGDRSGAGPTKPPAASSSRPARPKVTGPRKMKPRPIPGDYSRGYPSAYLAAAARAEARIRYEISELSPEDLLQRVREFYHIEEAAPVSPGLVQIYVDDYVNRVLDDTMWPHLLGGLNGLGLGAVSMVPDGDCFFHTILSEQAPESIRQRVTEVIGREPDVQAIRNYMADFLAAEFDRIERDPSAAASSPASFLLVDEDNPRDVHVDNIRRMGSFYNEASDLVPELFSYIFGVPLEVWQTRYRHQIGWSHDDPNAVPLVVVRRNLHFYAAGTAHGHPPTLNDPAVRHDLPPADVPTASTETQSRRTRQVPLGPRRPNGTRRGVTDPGGAAQDSSGGAGSKGAGGLRIDDPMGLRGPSGTAAFLDLPRGAVGEDVPALVGALAAAESALAAVEEDYWQKSTHSQGTCVSVTVVRRWPLR